MSEWPGYVELFGLAFTAALIAGVVCPLVGCFLLLRRTSFYGIALPQFAATGVAFGFAALPWWMRHVGLGGLDYLVVLEDTHEAHNYLLGWASVFTFGGLGLLVALGRGGGSEVARVAAAFALATSATVLFANASPTGEVVVSSLLRGEILAVGRHELETIAVAMGACLLCIALYHRDLLLVSFDRETARVLGKSVLGFEVLLALLTGLCVSAGAMTVGPVVLFGLLVLPPVAARGLARSMRSLYAWSVALGVAATVLGIVASFELDWPLGPSVVVAAAAPLPLGWWAGRR